MRQCGAGRSRISCGESADAAVEAVGGAVREGDADRHRRSLPSGPVGVGQLREHAAQALAPLRVDHLEVRVGLLDAPLQLDAQRVGLVDEQVDRQPDRDVGAHRRVERDQRALGRVEQRRARA